MLALGNLIRPVALASSIFTILLSQIQPAGAIVLGENDYSCKSKQPPVVLIHGLFEDASYLDEIAAYLQATGFCTYATTYGALPEFPTIGGVNSISASAVVLAEFIQTVKSKTGAAKVNLVGHSEGALMTLYIPKFEAGITSIVSTAVAIAPPTYGTTLDGVLSLIEDFGPVVEADVNLILDLFGCTACTQFESNGPIIESLTSGQIAQPGISYHIIASTHDEIVTPVWTAFVNETGVTDYYIQERCPLDITGHASEPDDINVIQQTAYYLNPALGLPSVCGPGGLPLKKERRHARDTTMTTTSFDKKRAEFDARTLAARANPARQALNIDD